MKHLGKDALRHSDSSPLFSHAPPFQQRAIVLRAAEQAQVLSEGLSLLGLSVISCPMIEIIPNKQALEHLTVPFIAAFTTLIFTSVNGTSIFFRTLIEKNIEITPLAEKKIFAVGPETANALKNFGISPSGIPQKFDGNSLLTLFNENLTDEKILIPRASLGRQILPQELRTRGAIVCDLGVYDTRLPKLPSIAIYDHDLIIFTSSSTVNHFFQSPLYTNQSIIPFCIGEYTRETLKAYFPYQIYTSAHATIESLIICVKEYLMEHQKEVLKR